MGGAAAWHLLRGVLPSDTLALEYAVWLPERGADADWPRPDEAEAVIGVLVVPRILRRNPGSEVRLIGITTVAAIVLALCFVAVEQPVARMIILSATMLFIVGVQPLYWSVLMARLGGVGAAAGLAFVNTIGLTGGFVGPYAFGLAETATGSPSSGLWVLIAATCIGLRCVPLLGRLLRRHDADNPVGDPEGDVAPVAV